MALDDNDLDRLAERVVEKLEKRGPVVTQRLFDAEAAAIYLGRSKRSITHMMQRGTVPVTKLDGRLMVDRVALDKLIEACTS